MSQGYHDPQVRKQISLFLPAGDWRALRDEAARQRLPLAELCRRWLAPDLDRLRRDPPSHSADARPSPRVEDRRRNHVWRKD